MKVRSPAKKKSFLSHHSPAGSGTLDKHVNLPLSALPHPQSGDNNGVSIKLENAPARSIQNHNAHVSTQ